MISNLYSDLNTIQNVYSSSQCTPGYVIGLQLLNPIQNRSTERIIIHDSQHLEHKGNIWHVKRDLSVFPVTSSSFKIIIEYHSGDTSLGGTVIVLTALQAPVQVRKLRFKSYMK